MMSVELIVFLCLCCFAIGTAVGMMLPFVFCELYNRMTRAFDFELFEEESEQDD